MISPERRPRSIRTVVSAMIPWPHIVLQPSLCRKSTPRSPSGVTGAVGIAPYMSAWPRGSHRRERRHLGIVVTEAHPRPERHERQDLLRVAAVLFAVAPEHAELVLIDLGRRVGMPHVGELRDRPEGLALAAPADQERQLALYRFRLADGVDESVVLAAHVGERSVEQLHDRARGL